MSNLFCVNIGSLRSVHLTKSVGNIRVVTSLLECWQHFRSDVVCLIRMLLELMGLCYENTQPKLSPSYTYGKILEAVNKLTFFLTYFRFADTNFIWYHPGFDFISEWLPIDRLFFGRFSAIKTKSTWQNHEFL